MNAPAHQKQIKLSKAVQAAHARLSPSGSKKWLACPGSLTLEEDVPNISSDYSDDGTAMHTVAAVVLKVGPEVKVAEWIGELIPVNADDEDPRTVLFTDDMAELTQGYVDTVRALAEGHELHVEQRLPFTEYLTIAPEDDEEQFGTADAVILRKDRVLLVIDLKTGYRYVEVEQNTQLMIYALAVIARFELSHEFDEVVLMIYQPRHGGMREWRVSVADLRKWVEEVLKPGAIKVDLARTNYSLISDEEEFNDWAQQYLNPTPNDQECAFCRVMATCPSQKRYIEQTVGADFEAIQEPGKVDLIASTASAEYLSLAMKAAAMIEQWIKAVRAETERRLLLDEPVPDFGLELGKQGNRAWTNAKEVERLMREVYRLKMEHVYDMTLISPTSAEKLAKVKKPKKGEEAEKPLIGSTRWKDLQTFIGRTPPKPSVKPLALIKELYRPEQPSEDDFDVVPDQEDLC